MLDAAHAQGFDAVGVTRSDAIPLAAERLREFVSLGAHGDMDWMAANAERRADPQVLWPEARSVVVLGLNYGPDDDPLAILKDRTRGGISVYARGDDYHELIKPRLKALGRWLIDNAGGDIKVFVDTAPLMEKPLAAEAGLGWQGKHTNLVSRQFGSWLFLGAILTTLDLLPDTAETDHCGNCRACLDVCPTAAFPAPYRTRCTALHLVSDHRAQGPDPARIPRADGQPHLRLRRLSRRLSVEQICRRRPRSEACRARGAPYAASRRSCPPR